MTAKIEFDEYDDWCDKNLAETFDAKQKTLFGMNSRVLREFVEGSTFIQGVDAVVKNASAEYFGLHKADLLMKEENVRFFLKPWDSAVDKSFRTNIIENENYPLPPDKGWVTPQNVYSRFKDLVRTTIYCKFMDGPAFLADKLSLAAKTHGLETEIKSQEKDSGYYAVHFYAQLPVTLAAIDMEEFDTISTLEIQITTQLQEILRDLSHPYYEALRMKEDEGGAWKWQHTSPRFRSSYMGHALHLIEGLLLELRDSKHGDQ